MTKHEIMKVNFVLHNTCLETQFGNIFNRKHYYCLITIHVGECNNYILYRKHRDYRVENPFFISKINKMIFLAIALMDELLMDIKQF